MWNTQPTRSAKARRSASSLQRKPCVYNKCTYARTPTRDPKLVCSRIFIHPSARLAGVSLMHMYRVRWLVLQLCQRATISIRTCKFLPGRRFYASRREPDRASFAEELGGFAAREVGRHSIPISRIRKHLWSNRVSQKGTF